MSGSGQLCFTLVHRHVYVSGVPLLTFIHWRDGLYDMLASAHSVLAWDWADMTGKARAYA